MHASLVPVYSCLPEVESTSLLTREFPVSSILDMVASRVARTPGAIAVAWGTESLSYAELDLRSNAVAARLRAIHVPAGQPVGIFFESSVELIVSALGVWKAGAAYLPIDPAYPVERASFILSDSGAPVLITRRHLAPTLGVGSWATLCIEDVSATDAVQHDSATPTSEDLAYVIYTSGSTGQPKGVEITHGNLLNLVNWHNAEFNIDPSDRATQIAGPGFDAAVWEIWPYLAAGASLHLPPPQARVSAAQLRDWIVARQITVTFVPTVLAEQVLHLSWPTETRLRILLTGGDALHTYPLPGTPFQVVNNYGPTECTVVATSGTVAAASPNKSAPSIGLPILNTSIHLLGEDGKEVQAGEAGELYIAGPSVGRGYRNRPELTAEKFVLLNLSGRPERAFKTGDLARRLPTGELAFVGRSDDQIKIRGFRIEPDEIAAVINRHPGVVSSVVIARADGNEKKLVAYIVAAAGAEIWDRDLRESLSRNLPDYMVPANFVLLEEIPITANGKLDKLALPAPGEKNQLRRDTYVAPRSELEEIVEGILSPILGLQRVSIHDNFFLLGGHSLMGAQVIAKVRDIFDVELNLRNVFECPTVSKLAAKIEASITAKLESMSEDEVRQALRAHVVSDLLTGGSTTEAG
jgi:amino acid adenylation domain-containing protein